MDLSVARQKASEYSGGTSHDVIKDLVIDCIKSSASGAHGSLLDFGAGKGELLTRLHGMKMFEELAATDLLGRPDGLPSEITWYQQDLNDELQFARQFDIVVCAETIEHLENPRHTFRCLSKLIRPNGLLVLTMPNQESIRSYAGLLLGGHFSSFHDRHYPAHITALVRLDLIRFCKEVGFAPPTFHYTNQGRIPKLWSLISRNDLWWQRTWQSVSLGLLKGRLFSENLAIITQKSCVS